MRKASLILWLSVPLIVSVSTESFSWYDICIDPGHGGTDAGCIGRIYGVQEKDVNLGVGLMVYSYFVYDGWSPIMTRYEDIDIDRPHRENMDKKACKILENY